MQPDAGPIINRVTGEPLGPAAGIPGPAGEHLFFVFGHNVYLLESSVQPVTPYQVLIPRAARMLRAALTAVSPG